MHDLYSVLGVAEDADLTAIRGAFRRLVMETHPDLVREATARALAEQRTRLLIQAYRTLGNSARRGAYDRSRGAERRSPPVPPAGPICPIDMHCAMPSGSVRLGRRGIGQVTLRNGTDGPLNVALRFADPWVRPKHERIAVRPWRSLILIFDIEGKECRGVRPGMYTTRLLLTIAGVEYPAPVPIEIGGGWL